MIPFRLPLALALAFAAVTVLAAACGGGGGNNGSGATGALTDPERVPTTSPWTQPPEIIILDPNNLVPISGGGAVPAPGDGDGGGAGEATPEPGVCAETYTIVSGDSFSLIAEKCGVALQDLLDANPDADPASLAIGQVIKIPQ